MAQTEPAVGAPLERHVRPCAWTAISWLQNRHGGHFVPERRQAFDVPLYDQAAIDAALNLWPRDCRLCAKFTTQTGGCTSTVQCVDSDQYKATAPRQYWVSGPNVEFSGVPAGHSINHPAVGTSAGTQG